MTGAGGELFYPVDGSFSSDSLWLDLQRKSKVKFERANRFQGTLNSKKIILGSHCLFCYINSISRNMQNLKKRVDGCLG